MRYQTLVVFFMGIIIIFPPVHAADLSASPTQVDKFLQYNRPKGSKQIYHLTQTIQVTNNENSSDTLSVSKVDPSNMDIDITSANSFNIGPFETKNVGIRISIPYDVPEDTWEGSVTISGGGDSVDVPVNVEIKWPPAKFQIKWSKTFDEVKAGQSIAASVEIKEVMKYKKGKDVELEILDNGGPAEFSYNKDVGDISAGDSKDVTVKMEIPERDLKPGTYNIYTDLFADNSIDWGYFNRPSYELPQPEMRISPTSIDFGDITFIPGKDTRTKTVKISEVDGYMPIEELSIDTSSAYKWVTKESSPTFVSPNSSETAVFRIKIPSDAGLGSKEWKFNISAPYTEPRSVMVTAKTNVYFHGVDEAIKTLRGLSELEVVIENEEGANLQRETITMLQNSRDVTDTTQLLNMMSVSTGAITMLKNLEEANTEYQNDDYEQMSNLLKAASLSMKNIVSSNEKITEPKIKSYSSKCTLSAKSVWESLGEEKFLSSLESKADKYESSNYRMAALYYKKIFEVYDTIGDDSRASTYDGKFNKMLEKYNASLTKAKSQGFEAKEILEEINEETIIDDNYIILNPFSYESVTGNLEIAMEKQEKAIHNYKMAGKTNEARNLGRKLTDVRQKADLMRKLFIAYLGFWGLVTAGIVGQVTIGIVRYNINQKEKDLSDVFFYVEE